MRVAVLGTGAMGAPVARNLAAAGHEVRAFDQARERAEGLGAEVAESAAAAVTGAEAAITMLTDGPAVEEVMREALPALGEDAVWIQMSTVGVAETERFAASHALFLDSPVLGSRPQAEEGALLALASGAPAARERALPVLDAVTADVLWLGDEPGLGTRLKLVANHWLLNLVENLAETLALAEALGLDPRLFLDAIRGQATDSPYAQAKGARILGGDFTPSLTLALGRKDLGLALEAAESAGLDLGLARATFERFTRALELGYGDEDTTAVWLAGRVRAAGEARRPPG